VYQRFPHEAFPLFFPLTVRLWAAVAGGSDLALRALGLGFGLLVLAALWTDARAERTVPLLSLGLVALHPSFLNLGDSLRGYGLGTALIVFAAAAQSRFLGRPGGGAFAVAATASTLAVHTLLHNAALVLAIGVAAAAAAAFQRQWRLALGCLGPGAFAGLSLLPYAGPLFAARNWDVLVADDPTFGAIVRTLPTLLADGRPALPWLAGLATAGGAVAAALRLRRLREPAAEPVALTAGEARALCFRLALVPLAFAAQCGFLATIGYTPRPWYWLAFLGLAACAVDAQLAAGGGRWPAVRLARLAVAIGGALLLVQPAATQATVRATNVDLVAEHLEREAARGDLVLVQPWFYGVSFARYYEGPAPWATVPELADHRFHRYDLFKERMASRRPLGDVLDAIRRTLQSGHRVWLVGAFEPAAAGERITPLRPAPEGTPYGWRDAPYVGAFLRQTSTLLARRGASREEIAVAPGIRVAGFESVQLRVFSGWRAKAGAEVAAGEGNSESEPAGADSGGAGN
jgi:hypothetical protein